MLEDPDMQEVIDGFCEESLDIIDELETILDELEDAPSSKLFESFGQKIDRIMGAARTLQLDEFGALTELGKTLGYKASQVSNPEAGEVITAILFDLVEVSKKYIHKIEKRELIALKSLGLERITKRAVVVSEKFNDITRTSVATEEVSEHDQKSIEALLKNLGL